jgi:hypothetical protein
MRALPGYDRGLWILKTFLPEGAYEWGKRRTFELDNDTPPTKKQITDGKL